MKNILLFADKLPPHIGGMEIHAHYFIEHFSKHDKFPLIGIIKKTAKQEDYLISNTQQGKIDLKDLPTTILPDILFFNSGHWIEQMEFIKKLFPLSKFLYRTGGNEILKASLKDNPIACHQSRQKYWVDTLNRTVNLMITNSLYTEHRLHTIGIACPLLRCVGGVNVKAIQNTLNTVSNSGVTLFCAARFVPYKNHSLLISIFTTLKSKGYNISLRLAGDGPLLNQIKQLTKKNQLDSSITFLGAIDNDTTCKEIARADIYIQMSSDHLTRVHGGEYIHSECMGRSILEALSAGTFIIATQSGALSEIIKRENGLLLDIRNPKKIISDIENVLNRPIKIKKPCDRFSWEKIFKKYESVFERI